MGNKEGVVSGKGVRGGVWGNSGNRTGEGWRRGKDVVRGFL